MYSKSVILRNLFFPLPQFCSVIVNQQLTTLTTHVTTDFENVIDFFLHILISIGPRYSEN